MLYASKVVNCSSEHTMSVLEMIFKHKTTINIKFYFILLINLRYIYNKKLN